jgi:hypothetical protein
MLSLILGFIQDIQASDKLVLPDLSPEKVADYMHSIIEADRTIYTTYVVKRMQEQGIVLAREDWESKNAIPLPAQFLHLSSKLVAESGVGIRFRLISLWPIHRRNGPATEFERKGLEDLQHSPDMPQRGIVTSGKKKFFQAIYADKAINTACASCHNAHPLSPKRDFQIGDLMGGVVITIPLE